MYENKITFNIMVISSPSLMSSYAGWVLFPTDLNKGAGGKWIYLCYQGAYL